MTDREKVLKALEHHKETYVCNGCPYEKDADTQECNCPVYDDAIALLREQEHVRSEWVSVKDRPPEDTRFVLVCNDDKKIMVAQYIDETAQWQYPYIAYDVDVWDDDEQGPIMWWMPLPEPPKETRGEP